MKILFISLGCDKNLVDSEKMLGILSREGYEFTDEEEKADIIIINTCCFIGDAKEESIQSILEAAQYKETGNCKVLLVMGCLAQRYRDEVMRELPEVDGIVGISAWDQIAQALEEALQKKRPQYIQANDRMPASCGGRIVTTGGHYAYLKIAEGCDKHCTYCIIPKIRGPYRSVPMEDLLAEAQSLAAQGVKELILVAQETTRYGIDLYGKKMLPQLLRKLAQIEGLRWIRIQYCYPEEITEELIQVIKEEPKICHYLDIPIQHASDAVLKRMGRRTNRRQITQKVEMLRREIPDLVLRTTLIAGFPGETEKDHQEMLDFVDEMEFDRLGVFAYSEEEDTPAAEMPDQIPEEIKQKRRDAVMELQQEIAFSRCKDQIGRRMEVMIEGNVSGEAAYVGRTYMDAPEVDGYLFVSTPEKYNTGDFVSVIVTGAAEYDLIGEVEDENEFTE